jgi:hypothetical protein
MERSCLCGAASLGLRRFRCPNRDDRTRSRPKDLVRHAAHHQARDASKAVGGHHDQVDVVVLAKVRQDLLCSGTLAEHQCRAILLLRVR